MTDAAVARHEIANVLHTYVEIADRKDVDAVLPLLGSATVRFPTDGYDDPADAAPFFRRLWGSPVPHRHDVTNLVVHPGPEPGTWRGRAHYTRWVFEPGPQLHTLGEYDVVISEAGVSEAGVSEAGVSEAGVSEAGVSEAAVSGAWTVRELTVTRTWTRPS